MEQPEKKLPLVIQGDLFKTSEHQEIPASVVQPRSVLSTLSEAELEALDQKESDDFRKGQL